jgi:hypothetical protein
MSDGIRVNGNAYSWGSIRFKLDGERYFQISEVTFSDKRERQLFSGMGTHQAPTARSRGKYMPETVKLKCLKETGHVIRAALSALNDTGGSSYGNAVFGVHLQYGETQIGGIMKHTDVEFLDCVYIGTSETDSEGPDCIQEEIEIQPMRILRDNKPLYDDTTADGSANL